MAILKAEPIGALLLVAIDFSDCSRRALHRARELIPTSNSRLFVLHVIDQRFVQECVQHGMGAAGEIKKQLFIEAKGQLQKFLQEQGFNSGDVKTLVCEGVPHVEIAKHAEKLEVDLIVMGSRGMAGNPDAIFFGGTAEKVMRFVSRPILCIPPFSDERKK